jgi:hypothetical protein
MMQRNVLLVCFCPTISQREPFLRELFQLQLTLNIYCKDISLSIMTKVFYTINKSLLTVFLCIFVLLVMIHLLAVSYS